MNKIYQVFRLKQKCVFQHNFLQATFCIIPQYSRVNFCWFIVKIVVNDFLQSEEIFLDMFEDEFREMKVRMIFIHFRKGLTGKSVPWN